MSLRKVCERNSISEKGVRNRNSRDSLMRNVYERDGRIRKMLENGEF
jgi:hypothetical protein